tara:strand:+ start:97 stop:657 length:561 start_codon:yes stop_codon:yes gene_type:complete
MRCRRGRVRGRATFAAINGKQKWIPDAFSKTESDPREKESYVDIKQLDERLSVTAQPGLDDLETLAQAGYRTIISNRPRGESEDQPDMRALQAKAEALGMVWREIPVRPGEYSQQDIDAFAQVLEVSPAPMIGFCRTGRRVSHLWAFSQAPQCPIADLMAAAQSAGHDLEPLKSDLQRYAREKGKA